jgi:hypothetical protein
MFPKPLSLRAQLLPALQAREAQDAGIDVSPAVQQFLALNGIDAVDWRFVSSPLPGREKLNNRKCMKHLI